MKILTFDEKDRRRKELGRLQKRKIEEENRKDEASKDIFATGTTRMIESTLSHLGH